MTKHPADVYTTRTQLIGCWSCSPFFWKFSMAMKAVLEGLSAAVVRANHFFRKRNAYWSTYSTILRENSKKEDV